VATDVPEPFLKKLASYLLETAGHDLSACEVVLPNKRAVVVLRKYLSNAVAKPIWAPRLVSVEEFVLELSGLKKADPVDLLLMLYQSYASVMKDKAENIPTFLPWGQLLLDDFNELDDYLCPIDFVFSYLSEAKAIELWNPGSEHLSPAQSAYLAFYHALPGIYNNLKASLLQKQMAYPGLAARQAVEKLGTTISPETHVVFAGLNALSAAEHHIMRYFIREHGAVSFWDADRYYMDDPLQEAGTFLRQHQREADREFRWLENHISTRSLNIRTFGISGRTGQAKMAAKILREWMAEGIPMDEKTAVVLADESLLLPVLNAIPAEIRNINITMGLPLRQTMAWSFFDTWFRIISDAQGRHQPGANPNPIHGPGYRMRHILRLLTHPWMGFLLSIDKSDKAQHALANTVNQQGWVYASSRRLHAFLTERGVDPAICDLLFPHQVLKATEALAHAWQLTQHLHKGMGAPDIPPALSAEEEMLFAFHGILQDLISRWQEYDLGEEMDVLIKVIDRLCRSKQLSFSGEPLQGLQVMGLLETRALDFDRIILLSANEDILPSGKPLNTFIPYDLRDQVKLPPPHHRARVFAYHFYRLLQRSNQLVCFYDTEPNELGGGERSRFLSQLMIELKQKNEQANIIENVVSLLPETQSTPSISIERTAEIQQAVIQKVSKSVSASMLNTFRNCSLKFYYNTIAGLSLDDTDKEQLGAKEMGQIFHDAAWNLYTPAIGQKLTPEILKTFEAGLDVVLRSAFEQNFPGISYETGRNRIEKERYSRYLSALINYEKQKLKEGTEIVIHALECEAEHNLTLSCPKTDTPVHVRLFGRIDRIDRLDHVYKVIDYKTGKRKLTQLKPDTLVSCYDIKENETFQLLFYAFMLNRGNHALPLPMQLTLYSVPALGQGDLPLKLESGDSITSETIDWFAAHLEDLLKDLINPDLPFVQTEDEAKCKYCDYSDICNRKMDESPY